MEGHLIMSAKERNRMLVFDRVKLRQLDLKQAAEALDLSYRQTRRSYKRFSEHGAAGLVHRSRGRPSNRAKPAGYKQKALERFVERYAGFGPTLAAEKLAEEGLIVDHETLRRWLLAAFLWHKCKKRRKHRARREPKAHFGELVQMDGSHHQWFGARAASACLVDMVDDAAGTTLSVMAREETTAACMQALWLWIKRYGVPKALYTDKKNIFITDRQPTIEEQLSGKRPLTAFGQACQKLSIEIISANSPQAKGRVERKHGLYQDRLVKELQLQQITTIEGANRLLWGGFVDQLNKKFARKPQSDINYHRPMPKDMKLDEIFCFEHTRTVANDWTIHYENQLLQIIKNNHPLPSPKDKVTVRILLDGRMQLLYREKILNFKRLGPAQSPVGAAKARPEGKKLTTGIKHIPAQSHPWRQRWKGTVV